MIRAVVFMLQILICRRVTEGQTQAFALGRRWRRSRRMRGKILVLQPLITRYAGASPQGEAFRLLPDKSQFHATNPRVMHFL